MSELESKLRETARQLLLEDKVDLIIGFEQGTLPLRTTPSFIDDPDDVDRLVWNLHCENNLSTYLKSIKGKVGIVAKGCDARSIVGEIVERQIAREDVVVIGMPCQGVIDRRAIEAQLGDREVREAAISNGQITLRGAGFETSLDVREALCDDCIVCRHKNPPLYDVLIGEPVEDAGVVGAAGAAGADGGEYPTVQKLESWSHDERWAYFSQEFSRCIRCYACREACPCCYCPECFVDQSQPAWIAKGDDLSDTLIFHLIRIYHVAGRCLDCGACARACPMGIDLRTLGRKLEKDVREMYAFEAGMNLEATPPLSTFQPDDPQAFIK